MRMCKGKALVEVPMNPQFVGGNIYDRGQAEPDLYIGVTLEGKKRLASLKDGNYWSSKTPFGNQRWVDVTHKVCLDTSGL